MNLIGKLQPVIIILAALSGLLLGKFTPLGNVSSVWIEFFLMLLLYILFCTVDLKQLKRSFENFRYTVTSITINFVITPVLAYILGVVFFSYSVDIRIGLLMLLVTPCTDWYLVFTGLSKGNVALNMSILPINLVLQIILMPVYLYLFMANDINIDAFGLIQSIVFVLLIPFILALITKKLTKNKPSVKDFIESQSDNFQLVFLCMAVVIMFASEGISLFENPELLLKMFIPLLIFFTVIFFISQSIAKLLKFDKKDTIALNFTTLARNSPLSLAIAVATFPEQPLISLSLVIGPLIELPILSIISAILLRWNEKE